MPSEHDKLILDAVEWAESLGYGVVERNLGTATGADAVFENRWGERVILEVVTGSDFKVLFKKPRIQKIFLTPEEYDEPSYMLGLVVVGDRIGQVKNHCVGSGLPADLFDPPDQRIFPVLTRHFSQVIPVLLVSLLGVRGSTDTRVR